LIYWAWADLTYTRFMGTAGHSLKKFTIDRPQIKKDEAGCLTI